MEKVQAGRTGARALALGLACVGLLLFACDAGWRAGAVAGTAERFELRVVGRVLVGVQGAGVSDLAELARGWPRAALALACALLAVACAQRAVRGPETAAGRWASGAAVGCAAFFALDPGLLAFVLQRQRTSALGYLDVGHALHATGLALIFIAALTWAGPRPGPARAQAARPLGGGAVVASLLAAGLVTALVPTGLGAWALDGGPLTNDGRTYAFQAQLFAAGSARASLGALGVYFPAHQILPGPEAYSKYPPGHSLILAAGALAGWLPLFVRLFAACMPALVHDLARRAGCARPLLAAWLFACSPMVLGVETLWLSHGTSLPCGLLALAAGARGLERIERGESARWAAAVAGLAVSLAALARPGTGLVLALCLCGALASRGARALAAAAPAALLAAAPAAALFFVHALASTGSALLPPYVQYAREISPNDRWGLVNLDTAWLNTAFNLARLDAWAFGVGLGLLWPLLGLLPLPRSEPGRLGEHDRAPLGLRWLVLGPTLGLIAFYALLRFHGVPWTGPLYFVEGLGGLAILAARGFGRRGPAWSGGLFLALALAGSARTLHGQFAAAQANQRLRDAPRAAAERWLAQPEHAGARPLVLVPLSAPIDARRYHLTPPLQVPGLNGVVEPAVQLARDPLDDGLARGLAQALGRTTVLRFDPATGLCRELEFAARDFSR